MTRLRKLWAWIKRYVVALPEPEITQPRQADNQGGAAGIKLDF